MIEKYTQSASDETIVARMPYVRTFEGRVMFYDHIRTLLEQYGIDEAGVLLRGLDTTVPDNQDGAYALTLAESQEKARHFKASPYDYAADAIKPAIAVYDARAFTQPPKESTDYHPLAPGRSLEDALLLLIELDT